MYTSSVAPSDLTGCRVESVALQYHRHSLCDMLIFLPTVGVLLLLGQMDVMAFFHSCMSKSVGCSTGQRIDDHVSCCGRRERTLGSTFPPEAVSTSDKNRTC